MRAQRNDQMSTAEAVTQLRATEDQEQRTDIFINWLQAQDDNVKMRFAINWRIPHSLFNVASKLFDPIDIQNINWFRIYKSKHLFTWSHGGGIY